MGTEERILRAIAHIHDNLDGDLSLDALADVAALSRFHFHRVFTAMTGETVADAIRRNRLARAALALATTARPVAEIGRRNGYDNPAAFGRAFRAAYGVTPAAFRRDAGRLLKPAGAGPHPIRKGERTMFPIEIVTAPDRLAIGLRHTGAYTGIGTSFEKLSAMLAARNLWPEVRGMVAVYHDDPANVPAEALRSLCAFLADPGMAVPEGMEAELLPGGRFAVMHHRGPYAGLGAAYAHLYGEWLPASGEEPRDAPPFEVYLNMPGQTAPADLLTDIWMPLA